jgi:outer membrane biogenesis lipoprotein LolB
MKKKINLLISGILLAICLNSWGSTRNDLSAEQMFQVLASEIALQRGEAALAYQTYFSLARNSQDPQLAQRAMEIAIVGNAPELALDAAKLWSELSNKSEAKEVLVTLLMINQHWSDSVKPATEILKKLPPAQKEKQIGLWRPLLAKALDEDAALKAFFEILQPSITQINDIELLYTFSLAAEKGSHFEDMEKILRRILLKKPNDKNALNALGYSFADRGIHLKEALSLLDKAHKVDPSDIYILDSLAWANYKLGNKQLAADQLQQAFQSKPEAEIGAHLGEVLWASDKKTEAQLIWRESELVDANNKTLKETLERLWPTRVPAINPTKNSQLWDGRFAIKIGDSNNSKGGSGAFTLTHENQIDVLDLRNPLGGALAKITISASNAKLESGDKTFESVDADSLLQNYLGLPLPARGLSKWLNGEARVGAPASIERDDLNRTKKMIQDNWVMTFGWSEKNQLQKMELKRDSSMGPIEIRLIFEAIDE